MASIDIGDSEDTTAPLSIYSSLFPWMPYLRPIGVSGNTKRESNMYGPRTERLIGYGGHLGAVWDRVAPGHRSAAKQ